MVEEALDALAPRSGERGVDATLGWGGHAQRLLERLAPGGTLLALDADPIELPRTEARLRRLGFDEAALIARRSNFAGLRAAIDSIHDHPSPRRKNRTDFRATIVGGYQHFVFRAHPPATHRQRNRLTSRSGQEGDVIGGFR